MSENSHGLHCGPCRRLISKANSGMSRATGDRQFLYLNGRPIDLPKVSSPVFAGTMAARPFDWLQNQCLALEERSLAFGRQLLVTWPIQCQYWVL